MFTYICLDRLKICPRNQSTNIYTKIHNRGQIHPMDEPEADQSVQQTSLFLFQ